MAGIVVHERLKLRGFRCVAGCVLVRCATRRAVSELSSYVEVSCATTWTLDRSGGCGDTTTLLGHVKQQGYTDSKV